MPYRVVAPDSGKSRFVQLLPPYTMWGYMYPDTDATGTVRGLANPTPRQAKFSGNTSKLPLATCFANSAEPYFPRKMAVQFVPKNSLVLYL